jgi:uncharacterized protein
MGKEELIGNVSNLVQKQCKKESNIFGYEIWSHHVTVVVKYAKLLAKKLEADIEIVEISALLHDYASIKDKNMYDKHHIYGAIEAEQILKKLDYPKEKINMVKECIMSHRGSLNIKRVTKEEICVASADAMAHIDQIPSLLHLAYCKRKMGVDEGAIWVSNKIERSWNKLCLEAKEIIKEKYISGKSILLG